MEAQQPIGFRRPQPFSIGKVFGRQSGECGGPNALGGEVEEHARAEEEAMRRSALGLDGTVPRYSEMFRDFPFFSTFLKGTISHQK